MDSMRIEELPFLVHMDLEFLDIILYDTENTRDHIVYFLLFTREQRRETCVGSYLLESARQSHNLGLVQVLVLMPLRVNV